MYVHVSFDILRPEDFVPRIPKNRSMNEDATIPRICAAPDIRRGLMAMPMCGNSILNLKFYGIPFVIHAYYLTPQKNGIMEFKKIQKYVPDAFRTKETWLTKPPEKVVRRDYVITDYKVRYNLVDEKMRFVPYIWQCTLKRVQNQDNWIHFLKIFNPNTDEEKIKEKRKLVPNVSYRSVAYSLPDLIQNMQERNKK